MSDHLRVKVSSEDSYFAQKAQQQIRDLRENVSNEATQQYKEEHKYHCFRCGTESLVEIQKGNIVIDMCVNDQCGALHLDAGELEALFEEKAFVKKARKSLFDLFK